MRLSKPHRAVRARSGTLAAATVVITGATLALLSVAGASAQGASNYQVVRTHIPAVRYRSTWYATGEIRCPSGQVATGGGAAATGNSTGTSGSSPLADATGWKAQLTARRSFTMTLDAVCTSGSLLSKVLGPAVRVITNTVSATRYGRLWFASGTASCPSGYFASGGGAVAPPTGELEGSLPNSAGTAWSAQGGARSSFSMPVRVSCVQNALLSALGRPFAKEVDVQATKYSDGYFATATARCPSGYFPISGGQSGPASAALNVVGSVPSVSSNGWSAQLFDNTRFTMILVAVCSPDGPLPGLVGPPG